MEDEKKILESERKTLENEKIKYLKDKEDLETEKSRLQKMAEEADKKAEIEKQAELQKKIEKELADKTEALKKSEDEKTKLSEDLNRAKGVIGQRGNPNTAGSKFDDKFYLENIKKITAEHDSAIQSFREGKLPMVNYMMKGFSEMVNLQAKAGNLTADLEDKFSEFGVSYADAIKAGRLLNKSDSDLTTPRVRKF